MNLPDAVKSGFQKYVTFSGRATRSEYWYWVLFYILIAVVLTMVGGPGPVPSEHNSLVNIWTLVCFLPSLAIGARRLHDIDKSGWWLLLGLIPIIGAIILIIWYCTKGTLGPNRFGIGL